MLGQQQELQEQEQEQELLHEEQQGQQLVELQVQEEVEAGLLIGEQIWVGEKLILFWAFY